MKPARKISQIKHLLLSLLPIQALAAGLPAINALLNSFIIGRFLGGQALAAMSFIVPLNIAVSIVNVVLSNGAQEVSGNSLGRGDRKSLNQIFNTTIVTATVIGVSVSALLLAIPEKIAYLLGARGDLTTITANYIRGIAPGYVFSILLACSLTFVQLERASAISNASVITALVVNCGGNILNALVFRGGTFGSGLATTAANFAAMLICFFFFVSGSKLFSLSAKYFDFGFLRVILFRGYPAGVPQVYNTIKNSLMNNCLFTLGGTPALAAMAIANNISSSIGCTIEGGFLGSLNLISSVLVGERDVETLRALPKQALKTAYPIYLTAYLLVFLLAKPFALLCGAEPENIRLYVEIICLVNLWFSTNPIKSMSASLYQAFGRHKFLTVLHTMNNLVYPIVCIFCGQAAFHSIAFVALTFAIAEFLSIVTIVVYYYMCRKRLPDSIFKLVDTPSSLSLPSAERYNRSMTIPEEISEASEGLIRFCRSKGFSSGDSNLCGLCVEEMAVVSLQNGLSDPKQKDFSIDLRVLHEEGCITIMLRDNGTHFDPNEWLSMNENEDPARCIGVKYVLRQAKEVRYTSTLSLNVILIKICAAE